MVSVAECNGQNILYCSLVYQTMRARDIKKLGILWIKQKNENNMEKKVYETII